MGRLHEWKDSKGNKVNLTSSAPAPVSTSSTKGGYWERFNRLLFYHVNHKSPAVDKIVRTKVSKDGFHYTEHYRAGLSGYDKDVVVKIDLATESWTLQTYIDGKPYLGGAGDGYTNLLKELRKHLTIPVTGTPEFMNLLTEWVDSNGKKVSLNTSTSSQPASTASSKTNKEKFTSLLYHMMKNKSSLVDKAEVVRLDDGGFTYKEHYKLTATASEYTLTLLVGYSRFNSSWRYELYMDTSLMKEFYGSGWEDLLEELEKYFHVPKAGSPEYKKLCESASIAEDFKLYENLWENI